MVMHDFHGLKTMTFHYFADFPISDLQLQRIIQFFSCNVTSETCSETKLKTGQMQDCQVFEILGSKHSLYSIEIG